MKYLRCQPNWPWMSELFKTIKPPIPCRVDLITHTQTSTVIKTVQIRAALITTITSAKGYAVTPQVARGSESQTKDANSKAHRQWGEEDILLTKIHNLDTLFSYKRYRNGLPVHGEAGSLCFSFTQNPIRCPLSMPFLRAMWLEKTCLHHEKSHQLQEWP